MGIRPFPFIYGSPRWVSSSPNRPPLGSASKERAWQNFVARVVKRYGPGGTKNTSTASVLTALPTFVACVR